MANYQYFYYSYILSTVFIQGSILAIQYQSTDLSNSRSIVATTVSYDHQDESFYANENSGGEMYDDEDEDSGDIHTSSTTNSQNMTSHLNKDIPIDEYDDEISSLYQEEDDEDETNETPMYGDTRSVDRPGFNRPPIDQNPKKVPESQTTSRMSFVPANLWSDLFSKPAILVGITGGIIIGMLSAILLVMFIIYRMRKKDEGSYVLEEAPRKSPSHAYTRVSSREFFA